MAIKEVRIGRTFYTVDSDTGQRVVGKKTQSNIDKLNKKLKGTSKKTTPKVKEQSSKKTTPKIKETTVKKPTESKGFFDNFSMDALKNSLFPGTKTASDKMNFQNTPVKKRPADEKGKKTFKKFVEKEDKRRAKTKEALDANKAARKLAKEKRELRKVRDEDARKFDKEYEKAAGREGPKTQHEAAMSGDYLHKMPSSKYGGGQDAREWAEEAAKEPSIIKQEPGGRVVWNKEGFEKYIPDNPFTAEKRKQNQELAKLSSSYDSGVHIDEQTGEEHKLDPQAKPESVGPMGDEMWEDKGSMPPKPSPTPTPTPTPTPKPEEVKTAPEPKSPMQDEMWDAKKYEKLTEDPKDKRKITLAEELLLVKGKDETARIRESSGNFYIDPFTGFALDLDVLSRSNKRAEIMDLAKLMPADKRAAFLYQKGVIKKADLDKVLEPSEKEQLDIDIQKAKLNEYSLKAAQAEIDKKNYRSPQEKEEFKMYGSNYRNAVTNDDFQGQMYWGTKLKMPNDVIEKLAKKGQSTGVPKNVEKHWKAKYGHSYDLHKNRILFQKESAKIFQEGQFTDLNGKTYSGRKQFFVDNGLKEWESIDSMLQRASSTGDRSELEQYFGKFSVYPKTRDGKIDLDKLTNKDDYNQFVARNFVHKAMATAYGGEGVYKTMLNEYQNIVRSNPNYIGKVTNKNN